MLFYVLFVLCPVYCLCVNVYCTTATVWLPNCSQQIYHVISVFFKAYSALRRSKLLNCSLCSLDTFSATHAGQVLREKQKKNDTANTIWRGGGCVKGGWHHEFLDSIFSKSRQHCNHCPKKGSSNIAENLTNLKYYYFICF